MAFIALLKLFASSILTSESLGNSPALTNEGARDRAKATFRSVVDSISVVVRKGLQYFLLTVVVFAYLSVDECRGSVS